ncbi:hypothetical protein EAG_07540 [Camponotus floridanus]|uniref:Uncharacterized protein n=1 Tax=Camponotus floridanus TaxID=104421 RepID=E2A423_CAMFO|nr:hypothetical protein EAG_07540 [Camponotus floridanus]
MITDGGYALSKLTLHDHLCYMLTYFERIAIFESKIGGKVRLTETARARQRDAFLRDTWNRICPIGGNGKARYSNNVYVARLCETARLCRGEVQMVKPIENRIYGSNPVVALICGIVRHIRAQILIVKSYLRFCINVTRLNLAFEMSLQRVLWLLMFWTMVVLEFLRYAWIRTTGLFIYGPQERRATTTVDEPNYERRCTMCHVRDIIANALYVRMQAHCTQSVDSWMALPNLGPTPVDEAGFQFPAMARATLSGAIYAVLQARRRDTLSNSARIILVLFAGYGSMRDHGAHPALPVS